MTMYVTVYFSSQCTSFITVYVSSLIFIIRLIPYFWCTVWSEALLPESLRQIHSTVLLHMTTQVRGDLKMLEYNTIHVCFIDTSPKWASEPCMWMLFKFILSLLLNENMVSLKLGEALKKWRNLFISWILSFILLPMTKLPSFLYFLANDKVTFFPLLSCQWQS